MVVCMRAMDLAEHFRLYFYSRRYHELENKNYTEENDKRVNMITITVINGKYL
jgi:hypothetical protein